MQNDNENILKKAIAEIPRERPPSDLWDRIEDSMLFASASVLPAQTAPVEIWEKVDKSYTRFYNRRKIAALLIPALLIVFLGTGYYIINKPNPPSDSKNTILPTFTEKAKPGESEQLSVISDQQTALVNRQSTIDNRQPERSGARRSQSNNPSVPHLTKSLNAGKLHNMPTIYGTKVIGNEEQPWLSLSTVPIDTDCSPFTSSESYSLGISAEYLFFLNNNSFKSTKPHNWFSIDMDFLYTRERFFMGLGVGYLHTTDHSNVEYSYLQNTLIDTYEYVDSIYYDPITGNTTYYTTTIEVYDSIVHSEEVTYTQTYTAFQVPVFAGFNLYNQKKWGLSAMVGVTYINQQFQKEVKPDLYHENSRIMHIYQPEARRTEHNFKLSLGIISHVYIDRNWEWTVTPSINYFTNELYRDSNIGNPIGLGIRTGIRYNF